MRKKGGKLHNKSIKDKNYKLPSYSNCLTAEINPRNYHQLKEFFEVAVRDKKIVDLNFKQLISSKREKSNPPPVTTISGNLGLLSANKE